MKKYSVLLALVCLCVFMVGMYLGYRQEESRVSSTYDVVVVGGGPAGIGAALSAARLGAHTALLERDSRIGGTTVQAQVTQMGLFYAWRRQIIAGPGWEMVVRAVKEAHDTLPDFSRQEPDKWMESCVNVDPVVYSRVAQETLREAGVDLFLNTEVTAVEQTTEGWKVGPVEGRQLVDATGNATVAALAGAERIQSPEDIRQPGSFFIWLNTQGMEFDTNAVIQAHQKAIAEGELLPTDVYVGMPFFIRKGGGSGCYVPMADNSTAEARAETNRRGVEARNRVLAFIRRQKGLENAEVVSSATDVGVRETYRVVGEKTITEEEYLSGTVADDALSWSYWMVDEHKAGTSGARLVFHEKDRVG